MTGIPTRSPEDRRGDDEVRRAVERWIERDPDPRTRAELGALLGAGTPDALALAVAQPLTFGTAGLRGARGPGPARMNQAVVRDAVEAICSQLLAEHGSGPVLVVVGRDARHGSAGLASRAVETLTARGFEVAEFDGLVPTPLLAFAVRHLGAQAGLMFTASHNPAADDGMKVYWSDGAQIVAPIDAEIEARIRELRASTSGIADHAGIRGTHRRLAGVERDDHDGDDDHDRDGGHDGDDRVVAAYVAHVLATRAPGTDPPDRPAPLVHYTALHGVGAALFERVAAEAGLTVVAVASQRAPDPDFPTVSSPNPEDPGVLDALVEQAARGRADLAIALDPDADRLAVVVPGGDGWRPLTGDETGALLAHHLLTTTAGEPDRFIASTIVTSRLVARMCHEAGIGHVETLTGFKWLCRPGLEYPRWRQVLLHEEALGYAVGRTDRDKDGISAALCAVDAIRVLAAAGHDVDDLLDLLARRHGMFVNHNGSVPLPVDVVAADMLPDAPPVSLGGVDVVRADRPAPDVLRWYLADDTRVVLRPSGTEPKLKYYCEAIGEVPPGAELGPIRRATLERLELVAGDLRADVGRRLRR